MVLLNEKSRYFRFLLHFKGLLDETHTHTHTRTHARTHAHTHCQTEPRSCVKVEVAVLGSSSLRVRTVSVDVRQP